MEEPHGGSVERPKCFDRFEGLHEENFEWSSAELESERAEDGDFRDPTGVNGHFEKLIPTESHPVPLVQTTTRDDACYLPVRERGNYQLRLRARARSNGSDEVRGQFVVEVLSVPVVGGRAEPTWSQWLTARAPRRALTEQWQEQHLNLPRIPDGVVALTIGYQDLEPEPTAEKRGEIWVDGFELLEFP